MIKATINDFEEIYAIMEESFPSDERRTKEGQHGVFYEPFYKMYVHKAENNRIDAFIAVWEFDTFLFIEHFAVDKALRNRGIGAEMLCELIAQTEKRICLEVEPPQGEMPKRRIAFYERNGFSLNGYDYYQPPMSEGKNAVPLMIMTTDGTLTKEEFENIRCILYKIVYKTRR